MKTKKNLQKIKQVIEEIFEVEDISTRSRERHIVDARKAFVLLASNNTRQKEAPIMKTIDRDRSSFYHLHKEATYLLESDKDFAERYCAAQEVIKEFISFNYTKKEKKSLANYHREMLDFFLREIDVIDATQILT